ncbi:hypothetical protein BT96DRAFT_960912 [Gymnopus androsaceus JB14]|uniref:ABC transporter domain-containing protein n=1 Tax=Gymnopus androsaceus JB14 TaxID=1447944 RepID=A0A6A4GFJ3_9AGAR|nr:hypothetical protein BT96DRAFT_960912 [Gymnopus androsaceus JB14]
MGESGAGKTTLLNVLAQRVSTGVVTGDMLVSGQSLPRDFQAQIGYCQQMDTHVGTDTVREALLLSAKLRNLLLYLWLRRRLSEFIQSFVFPVRLLIHFDVSVLNTWLTPVVGTLGVEHRKQPPSPSNWLPSLNFYSSLDEPTSGLDSRSAWAIMDFLQSLAKNGQAILCT